MKITDRLKEQEIKLIDLTVEQSNPSAFAYKLLLGGAVLTSALIMVCYDPLWSISAWALVPLSFLLFLVGFGVRYMYYEKLIRDTEQEIERINTKDQIMTTPTGIKLPEPPKYPDLQESEVCRVVYTMYNDARSKSYYNDTDQLKGYWKLSRRLKDIAYGLQYGLTSKKEGIETLDYIGKLITLVDKTKRRVSCIRTERKSKGNSNA